MRRGIATVCRLLRILGLPAGISIGVVLAIRLAGQEATQRERNSQELAALAASLEAARESSIQTIPTGYHLHGLTLSPFDLRGDTLTACALNGDWRGRSFAGVVLSGCDLSAAILDGPTRGPRDPTASPAADLRGCTYDALTRWPAGFDPRAAGARPAAASRRRSPTGQRGPGPGRRSSPRGGPLAVRGDEPAPGN
jgi:hypothetical protein